MQLTMRLIGGHEFLAGGELEYSFPEWGGSIGRDQGCSWVLDCTQKLVSRTHAMVAVENDQYMIYDGSSNGLFHNDSVNPVGPGSCVALEDGDTLRLGEFVLAVSVHDGAADTQLVEAQEGQSSAGVEPASKPVVEVLPELEEPATQAMEQIGESGRIRSESVDAAGSAALAFMECNDDLQPPAAVIPEDWELSLEPAEDLHAATPVSSVTQQLDSIRAIPVEALWEALGLDKEAQESAVLSLEAAQALGWSLRIALELLFRLKADSIFAEQKFLGRHAQSIQAPMKLDAFGGVDGFLQAVVAPAGSGGPTQLQAALREAAGLIEARQSFLASCLEESAAALVEQFAPDKFQRRYEQYLTDRGHETWFEKIRRRFNPGGVYWGFYRYWYASQRRSAFGVIRQLFESKFAALYAAQRKEAGASSR